MSAFWPQGSLLTCWRLKACLHDTKPSIVPQSEEVYLPKRPTDFPTINKQLLPTNVASLSIVSNKCYLQQEPWAFWHEGEGHHRADTGEGTDDHEHTPTVKLVGRPHAEAPSWKRRMGGVRERASQTACWESGDSMVTVASTPRTY